MFLCWMVRTMLWYVTDRHHPLPSITIHIQIYNYMYIVLVGTLEMLPHSWIFCGVIHAWQQLGPIASQTLNQHMAAWINEIQHFESKFWTTNSPPSDGWQRILSWSFKQKPKDPLQGMACNGHLQIILERSRPWHWSKTDPWDPSRILNLHSGLLRKHPYLIHRLHRAKSSQSFRDSPKTIITNRVIWKCPVSHQQPNRAKPTEMPLHTCWFWTRVENSWSPH